MTLLDEAVERYRELFFNAVEIRMRADVKVSFELSGGLDSSTVAGFASGATAGKAHCVTIGFEHADYDQ